MGRRAAAAAPPAAPAPPLGPAGAAVARQKKKKKACGYSVTASAPYGASPGSHPRTTAGPTKTTWVRRVYELHRVWGLPLDGARGRRMLPGTMAG